MIETREETFLRMALQYMNEYNATPWWKFIKRYNLKKNWYSAIECMIKYS